MNRIVSIGYMSVKTCYLNVSRDEAIRRFLAANPEFVEIFEDKTEKERLIDEFEFADEFGAYYVYA